MFWAILAPEILPCWALNQLLAAITVRDVYNKANGRLRNLSDNSSVKHVQVMRRRGPAFGRP